MDGANEGHFSLPQVPRRLSRLVWFLLIVMALDIGRAAVQQNYPFLDLPLYAHLKLTSPYQERLLMVPILRAAEASPHFAHLYRILFAKSVDSPETLVIILCNCLCLVAMLPVTAALRRALSPRPATGWLAPLILLWVVCFTYVVRYEQRFSLPYDFPSLLLYNLGLLAVLYRRGWLLLLVLAVAVPNRETAVFLLAPWFWLQWRENRRVAAVAYSAAGLAIFFAWRIAIAHTLRAPTQVWDFPLLANLRSMAFPVHWPQLLSTFGFLLLPVWVLRGSLRDRRLRDLWLASGVFIAAALAVGIWWETRIFGELSALVAVSFAMQLEALLVSRAPGVISPPERVPLPR